jgi:hypothetical protein
MGLCKRAKTLSYSGCLAPSPDAGSLPLLLMIMKLVCVLHDVNCFVNLKLLHVCFKPTALIESIRGPEAPLRKYSEVIGGNRRI